MKHSRIPALGTLAFLVVASSPVGATDGYFANGYGTNYKAMGGAGVALYLGTQAPATNPASMAFLGRRFDIGIEAFNPNRQFTVTGSPSGYPGTFGLAPGTVESGSESVNSVGNDFLPNLGMTRLGMVEGAGFGWHDMTVYKGGLQFAASKDWILRGGYSYAEQPIRENEVLINILAPGVIEHHVSAGLTRSFSNGRAINLAIVRAIPKSISGPNNLEVPGRQTIELKMDQWEIDFSYSFGIRK